MKKVSSIFRFIHKIFLLILILSMVLQVFPIENVISDEMPTENQTHIYTCDGISSFAYEGSTTVDGGFDSDDTEFTYSDYEIISENETSNFVEDNNSSYLEYQYHRFDFKINESLADIDRIDITWKGDGGADLLSYPPKYNIDFRFWVKETSSAYVEKYTGNSYDTVTISYTSSAEVKRIFESGRIYCGIQSDYAPDSTHGFPSYVKSYYVELKVTYTQVDEEPNILDISNPNSVYESEEFDVTITSNSIPIQSAFVEFNGLNYSTNEYGIVTFSAPEVTGDESFDISVSKNGYTSNSSSILILNNDSPTPELEVSSSDTVYEGEYFDVTAISNGLPVKDVVVSFDNKNYITGNDGKVTINAPSVDSDESFVIALSKSGFVSDSKTITVLDSAEASITLLYPNGGETISGVVDVSWNIVNPKDPSAASIGLFYKPVDGSWVSVSGVLNVLYDNFLWDTSSFEDGEYLLKIVLIYDENTYEDISDESFTIDNSEEVTSGQVYGSVFGIVNDDKIPIENSMLCLINPLKTDYKIYKCRFTNTSGEYLFNNIPAGLYYISASKEGYNDETYENVQIEPSISKELNFSLEKTSSSRKDTYNDYIIDQEIKKGSIFGKVDVTSDEDEIFLYEDVDVSILSRDILSDDGLTIRVSGNGTPGTKLVIYLGAIENPEKILVKYDDSIIEQSTDIESFFEIGYNKSEYVLATVSNGITTESIIIVNVRSYSTHIITISSAIESINIFFMIVAYILVFAVLGIVYISPFFLIRKSK